MNVTLKFTSLLRSRALKRRERRAPICRRGGEKFWAAPGHSSSVIRHLLLLVLLLNFVAAVHANTLMVNVAQRGGALKKAGLGSLFGIVTNNVGSWKYYMTNSLLFVSEHQTRIGEGTMIPSSTSAVAPVIRGSGIKMMCRFGDLCYGWAPYTWPGLNNSWLGAGATHSWLAQVTNAATTLKITIPTSCMPSPFSMSRRTS